MIQVIRYTPEEIEKDGTGVVALVNIRELYSSSIAVRRGCVDLVGSAYMTPSQARQMAQALLQAAEIAEEKPKRN